MSRRDDPKSGCPRSMDEDWWAEALTSGPSRAMERHALGCTPCRTRWERHQQLVGVARQATEATPTADASAAMRQRLLAAAALSGTVGHGEREGSERARRGAFMVAIAATVIGAVGLLGWWMGAVTPEDAKAADVAAQDRPAPSVPEDDRFERSAQGKVSAGGVNGKKADGTKVLELRAQILAHGAAEYLHARDGDDEIVRLVTGALTVSVPAIAGGPQVRVVTGAGSVTVRGTLFDVRAADDRLVAVSVVAGLVQVTSPNGEIILLRADERWERPNAAEVSVGPVATGKTSDAGDSSKRAHALATTAAPNKRPVQKRLRGDARSRRLAPSKTPSTKAPVVEGQPAEPLQGAPSTVTESPKPDGSKPDDRFRTAWKAFKAKDYAAAEAGFRAMLGGPGALVPDAAFWRAVALTRLGRRGEAAKALRAFRSRYPASARYGEATVMLGWIVLKAGDAAGARALFKGASSDPSARVRRRAHKGLEAAAARQDVPRQNEREVPDAR